MPNSTLLDIIIKKRDYWRDEIKLLNYFQTINREHENKPSDADIRFAEGAVSALESVLDLFQREQTKKEE